MATAISQSMLLNKHMPTMSERPEHVDCLSHNVYTTACVWRTHHNTLSILVCSFLHMGALEPQTIAQFNSSI